MPRGQSLSTLGKKIVNNIRLESWSIEGAEKNSREKLAIFYSGSLKGKNYFCKIAYNGGYRERYLGRIPVWDLLSKDSFLSRGHPLVIIESYYLLFRPFITRGCFIIPSWVSSLVDISSAHPDFEKNKSLKNDIRRVLRNKFTFQLTREPSQFDNFYYNMYKPYVENAHRESAIIDSYHFMKRMSDSPHNLCVIKKENEPIAASLFLDEGCCARVGHLGVKEGNMDYVKQGAVQAMFYFSCLWSKQNGFRSINLGLSRPFLNDGVLRFKKKWSPTIVCKKWAEKVFLMRCSGLSGGLKGFLVNNPFIFIKKNNLSAAFFTEDPKLIKNGANKIYKRHEFKGLFSFSVYQFSDNSPTLVREERLA